MTDLLAKKCVFAGKWTAARHGFEGADGFDEVLIPALCLFGVNVLGVAKKSSVGFCFGYAGKVDAVAHDLRAMPYF
mgnify:CR=1 FL=1